MDYKQFFSEWFNECEGNVELRALPSRNRSFYELNNTAAMDSFLSKNVNENLYFGIATRNGGGGGKENIVDLPGAWCELDFKLIEKKDADKLILEAPLQPSFIIGSGGGFHLYWRFKEPTQNIENVEYINTQVHNYFGKDQDNVAEAARIFRVPGTKNYKYDPPRDVTILSASDRCYNPSDFEESFPLIETPETALVTTNWETEVLPGVAEGSRSNAALKLARSELARGREPVDMINTVRRWNLQNNPPLPDTELMNACRQALKYHEKEKAELPAKRIQQMRDWLQDVHGIFTNKQCMDELNIPFTEKAQVSTNLARLATEGLILRAGNKYGYWRRLEEELKWMPLENAEDRLVDIKLPFGLNDMIEIRPGNIIVVAGSVNAGKTALLLNLIVDNMYEHECFYFTSELNVDELGMRLRKFDDVPYDDWVKHLKAAPRSRDFADVIQPGFGRINFIDYIEMSEEFYKIGGYLTEIHERLGDAIAVVALQKNPGVDVARGGYGSMEKPRLYLAMDSGKIKITKAKNWKGGSNPNGLECTFKLYSGAKLEATSGWLWPEKKKTK